LRSEISLLNLEVLIEEPYKSRLGRNNSKKLNNKNSAIFSCFFVDKIKKVWYICITEKLGIISRVH
jgi:hypothetical protein